MSQIISLLHDQFPKLEYCDMLQKDEHVGKKVAGNKQFSAEMMNWLDWFGRTNLDMDLFRVQLKDKAGIIFKKVSEANYLVVINRRENLAMLLTFLRGLNYLKEQPQQQEKKSPVEKAATDAELKMMDAHRIQQLIIPSLADMQASFSGLFVVHQQQDVVGGDFYWYQKVGDSVIIAIVDCTGHSVEGAMTSMVCNSLLNQALVAFDPSHISVFVKYFCDQIEKYNETTQDMFNYGIGAELGVFCFNHSSDEFRFASTGISAFLKRKGEVELLKAKKIMVPAQLANLQDVVYPMSELEGVYGFTDGLTDQFNATDNKKLGYRGVKQMISNEESFNSSYYSEALEAWKGDNIQYDDITMIGIAV